MALTKKQLEENGFREVKEDGTHYYEYVFNKKNYKESSAIISNDVQDNVGENEKVYQVHLLGVYPDRLLTNEQVKLLIKIYGDED